MIYITQLIFVHEGKESVFHEFEDFAIPLMSKYNGKLLYRFSPSLEKDTALSGELPYEVHFISFDTDEDLTRFMNDKSRQDYMHLKEASVKTTFLVKGQKM